MGPLCLGSPSFNPQLGGQTPYAECPAALCAGHFRSSSLEPMAVEDQTLKVTKIAAHPDTERLGRINQTRTTRKKSPDPTHLHSVAGWDAAASDSPETFPLNPERPRKPTLRAAKSCRLQQSPA